RRRTQRSGAPAGRVHHPGAGGQGGRPGRHGRPGEAPGARGPGGRQRRPRKAAGAEAPRRRPVRHPRRPAVDDHRLTAEGAPPDPPAPRPPGSGGPARLRGPAWQLVLALAGPELLRQLLTIAVQLSDRLLAGRFQDLDPEAQAATLAAQTTAGYLAWFLTC